MDNSNPNIINGVRLIVAFLAIVLCLGVRGAQIETDSAYCHIVTLKPDTLPSLNIARAGHLTLCIDGELTVFGGHGDGFVPTPTAEYLHEGAWHTVPLIYPHDNGTGFRMRNGEVFLAGGHKEPLGIGQLFSVELYDPASHTSHGRGCMDIKRAYPNAIEMADSQIVISGNWFYDDGIEMFDNLNDPTSTNAVAVKETAVARAVPYILRVSDDDAIVFGSLDHKSQPIDPAIVDRVKGPTYREPFLETWHPIPTIDIRRSYNQFIGNEAEGRYEWLLPVENHETGRVAIARVKGPVQDGENPSFTIVSTQAQLPDSIQGKRVIYGGLVCDRERGVAYLIGDDNSSCIFVVAIQYESSAPSPLTIYVADQQPIQAKSVTPVLTPEGDLVFAGGRLVSNFSPTNAVIRLPMGRLVDNGYAETVDDQIDSTARNRWIWIVGAFLISCCVVALLIYRRRDTKSALAAAGEPQGCDRTEPFAEETYDKLQLDKNPRREEMLTELFERIQSLMDEEQIFLNANLKISDVAIRLGSNITYVSEAIKVQSGYTFTLYLNNYRVAYAQRLMRQDPESKMSTISNMSGFSNDSTFFRVFRTITGMSPKEWLANNYKA